MKTMDYKDKVPTSIEELKRLPGMELARVWERYFPPGTPILKALWYKIQCEREGVKLTDKHRIKLSQYAKDPEGCVDRSIKTKYILKSGTEIVKTYKGKEYRVRIEAQDRFFHAGKRYSTISAVASAIAGMKVSGYDFFGLSNKNGGYVHDKQG